MLAVIDSTVLFHFDYREKEMVQCYKEKGVTEIITTRVNYLEILSGTSENRKLAARKFLKRFAMLEISDKSIEVANKLAMKYRVSTRNQRDFLIACIAIANKLPLLTENTQDFTYKELKVLPYRISDF